MLVNVETPVPGAVFLDVRDVAVAPDVAELVQELARELLRETDAIAAAVTRHAVVHEPALVDPDDPTSLVCAGNSTNANVGAILSMLAFAVAPESMQPPRGALELFERLADRDDGLRIILRGYRLGIRELWQQWAEFVARRIDDARLLHRVLAASTRDMDTYVDRISDQLACEWHETRRRHRQGVRVSVEDIVRRALFGGDHEGVGLTELDYPAHATHLALALPCGLEEPEVDALARKLRDWADAQVLAARVEECPMIWLAFGSAPTKRQVAAVEKLIGEDEAVGIGEPTEGIDGFRATRREALDARRIAMLRGNTGLTRYRDVALVAVLCADPDRARALARAELGPLADDTEPAARLRDTIATYLACGESHVGAAQRLYVHQKTVAYRVRQAEQLLERRLCERRAELEAALLVHRALGGDI